MFEVIPAVDIAGGDVVRLREGDPAAKSVYGRDPVTAATRWVREGARRLHVVDLDAAFAPGGLREGAVRAIAGLGAQVQLGGGIRDLSQARAGLAAGAARLVVGTLAAEPGDLAPLVAALGPERLVVALDIRGGRLQVQGWRRSAALEPLAVFRAALALGVRSFLVTAVERDGTEAGPDLPLLGRFLGRDAEILASGGVRDVEDLRRLRQLGLQGAIVGRALYEGRLRLADALEAAAC